MLHWYEIPLFSTAVIPLSETSAECAGVAIYANPGNEVHVRIGDATAGIWLVPGLGISFDRCDLSNIYLKMGASQEPAVLGEEPAGIPGQPTLLSICVDDLFGEFTPYDWFR